MFAITVLVASGTVLVSATLSTSVSSLWTFSASASTND